MITGEEFRRLHEIPMDVSERNARIAKLEAAQKSDVMQSPGGTAGCTEDQRIEREQQIRELRRINEREMAIYKEGCALIEGCKKPRLRATLSALCIKGLRYKEIAILMEENGIHANADALRKSVERWIKENLKKI